MNPLPKFKVDIIIDATQKPEEAAIWLFYPMARSMYITEHPELYDGQSGMIIPTFEEEVKGRFMLADGSDNKLKHGQPIPSQYLTELLRVHQAGFLREYVWWYLGQPSWSGAQQPPNLLQFMAWAREQLPKHTVETHGGVKIVREASGTQPPPLPSSQIANGQLVVDVQAAGGAELSTSVMEIKSAIKRGNAAEAARLLQIFSTALLNLKKEADASYMCFQSNRQLNFFLLGHPEIKKLRVPDWCVVTGLFFKVFFLSKTQRFAEALYETEALLKLAPFFAHGQQERGYILARLKRPKEALEAYQRAWELCARFPENVGHAGASLRGQSVALVELGDLERAEKLLRDSLIVDPGSSVAKNELLYIQQRRSGQAGPANTVAYTTTPLVDQLAAHNLQVHRGRYHGPWPGIGVSQRAQTPAAIEISEEGLGLVARLGNVTRLYLASARLSPGAVRQLQSLSHLRQLDLNRTTFSDVEVEFIHRLPELRWLNLFKTGITDRTLEMIAQLPKLGELFIGGNAVSDEGLVHLSKCPSLRYLDLEGNQITDQTLNILSRFTGLEGLNIACRGEQISDQGVAAITKLANLRLLGFVKPPQVSDDIFQRVKSLPVLKNLVPSGCAFLYRTGDPIYEVNEPLV